MIGYFAGKISSFLYSFFAELTRHVHSLNAVLFAAAIMLVLYLVYRIRAVARGADASGALAYLFPSNIYAHKSSKVDYLFILVDSLIKTLLLSPAIGPVLSAYGGSVLFVEYQEQLLKWFGQSSAASDLHNINPVIFAFSLTFVVALVYELVYYVQHYLTHKIPFLWEFHKAHHSAGVLTPAVAYRIHPVDRYFILLGTVLVVPVLLAVLDRIFGTRLEAGDVFAANALVGFLKSVLPFFQHSHLKITYGRSLSHVFMSPAYHFFHHSCDPRHFDKNFGDVFSLWDWVFGTLYIPRRDEKAKYGLPADEHEAFSSVWELYLLPFRKNLEAKRWLPTIALLLALVGVIGLSLDFVLTRLLAGPASWGS